MRGIIQKVLPDEIYHFAAQSSVAVSFSLPEYTAQVNTLSTCRILEIVRDLASIKQIRFYNVGLYGTAKHKRRR